MTLHPARSTTQVRPRPEGGGDFAPALGGGSGANRAASGPDGNSHPAAVPDLIRDLHSAPFRFRPGDPDGVAR